MLGRYEEDVYLGRMIKVIGYKETYIYELGGYDYGSLASPVFHILQNHIGRTMKSEGSQRTYFHFFNKPFLLTPNANPTLWSPRIVPVSEETEPLKFHPFNLGCV